MTNQPHDAKPDDAKPSEPQIAFTQEVRFAVVMYGGISLAIYMNGVAQEMLSLARATAPDRADRKRVKHAKLEGAEGVYRKLGRMLRRGGKPLRQSTRSGESSIEEQPELKTRFIVDVISGSSAGGINGVFLAKALANDQPMDRLTNLWVQEGDFDRLLNDRGRFRAPAAAADSLLDGTHMYRILLSALEEMDGAGGASNAKPGRAASAGANSHGGKGDGGKSDGEGIRESPYGDEIDLFVTTTDVSGLTLPLQLADGVVYERRHRNTFHFVYSTEEASGEFINHFESKYNPFLAYAARCTSSFPVAFPPMRLRDIDGVVSEVAPYKDLGDAEMKKFLSSSDAWRDFYQDYLRPRPNPKARVGDDADANGDAGEDPSAARARDFAGRAFADGGNLDNKPFSYATDTLLRRRADLPVERKLIFIDPDPEKPEQAADFDPDIDFLQNTLAALSPTVSTETIREDIQRILERNRLIERLEYVTRYVDDDVGMWRHKDRHDSPLPGLEWSRQGIEEMINSKGISYGGYHRLKVDSVTDDLARVVASAANFEDDSAHFIAIRDLIRAWRDSHYDQNPINLNRPTQHKFLMDFDLSYRLRRLNFVRARIDELSRLDAAALGALREERTTVPVPADGGTFYKEFREALRNTQKALSEAQKLLLRVQRLFLRRGAANPLYSDVVKLESAELDKLLERSKESDMYASPKNFLVGKPGVADAFDLVKKKLLEGFSIPESSFKFDGLIKTTKEASGRCEAALSPPYPLFEAKFSDAKLAVCELLWHYYKGYEDYDMVIFPVTYQTGVGETSRVDVIRVSPYDAKNLIDESKEGGRRKLAGTTLGHFGAFFDRTWRRNDIMWGRLDAAERIITTLLPKDHPDCQDLVDEAHLAILQKELLSDVPANLRRFFIGALAAAAARVAAPKRRGAPPRAPAIELVLKELAEGQLKSDAVRGILDSCVEPGGILDYFKGREKKGDGTYDEGRGGYEVSREIEPRMMVEIMARSTTVFGHMLEALADKHSVSRRQVAWVTRLGRIFWGLVEVAVPGSFRNSFFRHWVKLPYLLSLLLVVLGTLLLYSQMQVFGLVTFLLTATTHLAVGGLGNYMRTGDSPVRRSVIALLGSLLAVVLILLASVGAYDLYGKVGGGVCAWIKGLWAGYRPDGLQGSLVVAGLVALAAFLIGVAYRAVKQFSKPRVSPPTR
jgi:patatin-related protein